jgi:hypothetical protein
VLCKRTVCRREKNSEQKAHHWAKREYESVIFQVKGNCHQHDPVKIFVLVWFFRVDALKASDHTVTKLLKLWRFEVKAIQELFALDFYSRS